MQLRKVSRKKSKLRIGLSAASGYGKTYSSLLLAKGIAQEWNNIALIDTENGRGDLYSHLGDYNILSLGAPYSPERYIEAIKTCEEAGVEVIIIDSITHEWDGKGGCLEIHEKLGGSYREWAKVTPRHRAFIDAILQSKCHIITTVRRKQDYQMTTVNGKTKVQKMGTKEVTREGFEYELTLNFEIINDSHLAKASKDRTRLFDNQPEFIITEETGKSLLDWANEGEDPLKSAINDLRSCSTSSDPRECLEIKWKSYPQYHENKSFIDEAKKLGEKFPKEGKEVENVK